MQQRNNQEICCNGKFQLLRDSKQRRFGVAVFCLLSVHVKGFGVVARGSLRNIVDFVAVITRKSFRTC